MESFPREITSHIMSFFGSTKHDLLFEYLINCLHLETLYFMSTKIEKLTIPLKHQQQKQIIKTILEEKIEKLKEKEKEKPKEKIRPDKVVHFFKGNSSTVFEHSFSLKLLNDLILNHFDTESLEILVYSLTKHDICLSNFYTNDQNPFEQDYREIKKKSKYNGEFNEFQSMFKRKNFFSTRFFKREFKYKFELSNSSGILFEILKTPHYFPNLSPILVEFLENKENMNTMMNSLNLSWDIMHDLNYQIFIELFEENFISNFKKIIGAPKSPALTGKLYLKFLQNYDFTSKPLDTWILEEICQKLTILFNVHQFEVIDKLRDLHASVEDHFYTQLEIKKYSYFQQSRIDKWNDKEMRFMKRMMEVQSSICSVPESVKMEVMEDNFEFEDYELVFEDQSDEDFD
jgi:hypothetical protein